MRSARPLVAIAIILASGTAGLLIGMLIGLRDVGPLYLLQVAFTWGLAGSAVGMAAGAVAYAAALRLVRI